jgi:hypothetical protein
MIVAVGILPEIDSCLASWHAIAPRGLLPLRNSSIASDLRECLIFWIKFRTWFAVFGQAYENAPNSQSAKDFSKLVAWLEGGTPPESISGLRFDPRRCGM